MNKYSISQDIKYLEIVNWINHKEYPSEMFSKLENKNFSFYDRVTFIDCNGFTYEFNGNNSDLVFLITAFFCDYSNSLYIPDIEIDRKIQIQAQKKGGIIFEKLVESIKANCTLVNTFEKKEQFTYNTYIYTNNKGLYFTFHKYFMENRMAYFMYIERAKSK